MTTRTRIPVAIALAALFTALVIALLRTGVYGFTVFMVCPSLLGGLAAWALRPRSAGEAAGIGALACAAGACFLLLLGMEGLLCVAMALPLVVPLGALGAWIAYRAEHWKSRARSVAMLALLPPVGLTCDLTAHPPTFVVHTVVQVAAPPERVWKQVIASSNLPQPREWFFRAGIAYPLRAHIEGSGPAATRYCDFTTGELIEPVEAWDEPRLLRFRVTHNPAPMREWSPYGEITPKHLSGYFVSEHGQFRLTALTDGRTSLEATTWYRHGLWPAEYWRWWSDAIIHRIHFHVLAQIKTRAEAERTTLTAAAPFSPHDSMHLRN